MECGFKFEKPSGTSASEHLNATGELKHFEHFCQNR